MKAVAAIRALDIALTTSILVAACGGSDAGGPSAIASVSGIVKAASGAAIEGASVKIGSATATSGADGQFALQNLPVGNATIVTSAPDFDSRSQTVQLTAGNNTLDVVLTPVDRGEWGLRAGLLVANSEFALAESNGKIYGISRIPTDVAHGTGLRHFERPLAARTGSPAAQQPRDGCRRKWKGLPDRRPGHG